MWGTPYGASVPNFFWHHAYEYPERVLATATGRNMESRLPTISGRPTSSGRLLQLAKLTPACWSCSGPVQAKTDSSGLLHTRPNLQNEEKRSTVAAPAAAAAAAAKCSRRCPHPHSWDSLSSPSTVAANGIPSRAIAGK
jgi:hypothetical protein